MVVLKSEYRAYQRRGGPESTYQAQRAYHGGPDVIMSPPAPPSSSASSPHPPLSEDQTDLQSDVAWSLCSLRCRLHRGTHC